MAFVGTRIVKDAEALRSLLKDQFSDSSPHYFLRWPHQVSGFKQEMPEEDFPSPEGQIFNHAKELRWRQQGDAFSVLILSTQDEEPGFTAIALPGDWETEDHNAHIHPSTETRFPKEFSDRDVTIKQRYFRQKKTATVHFIALTTGG